MPSLRTISLGALSLMAAATLVACGPDDSSSSGVTQSPTDNSSPSTAVPGAKRSATDQPTGSSNGATTDSNFKPDEVCYKYSAKHLHALLGYKDDQKVTPTDKTTNSKSSDPLIVRDPSLCTYKLPPDGSNSIAIGLGTGSEAADAWSRLKARNKAHFRHDLGGDEVADMGDGMYVVRKGGKFISVQGLMSGLSTTDLERVTKDAAGIL